ncbi:hypothetical protein MRX96_059141 [Rhipicephalus microplus]
MDSGMTSSSTSEARLHHRHRLAPGLKRCSRELLLTSSLEGERGRVERVSGAEGSRRICHIIHALAHADSLEDADHLGGLRAACTSGSDSSS